MMFSQDESDVVNRNSRGGEDSDAGSMKSNVPTSVKNRRQNKRVIDGNETESLNISQLHLNNGLSNGKIPGLPGVYKNVSLVHPLWTNLACFLTQITLQSQLTRDTVSFS